MTGKKKDHDSGQSSDTGSIGYITFNPMDSIKKLEKEIPPFPQKQTETTEDLEDNDRET